MPTKTDLVFYIGSDMVVRMTTDLGDITGMTFLARIADVRTGFRTRIIDEGNSVVTIQDAEAGVVDWVIEAGDWPSGVRAGSEYRWDLWRDDDGSNVPLGWGTATLQRLPGSE